MPETTTQTSSIANTSSTSNPLDGTLFPPLFKAFGEFWDTTLSIEVKNNLVLGINLVVIALAIYLVAQLVLNHLQKTKPRFGLKIKTQPNFFIKDHLGAEMYVLSTKLHKLAKGSVITFEIHKTGMDQYFLITSHSKSTLGHIKAELKKITGLGFEEYIIVTNIFDNFGTLQKPQNSPKPHQLQLSASSKFGLFKKAEYRIIDNVCKFLTELPMDDNGIVVLAFRPNYITYKIKSLIAKLNYKARKDSKEYGTDLGLLEEIKDLNDKKTSEMFTVKITVIGSSSGIVDQLASCFGLINSSNKFNEKISNASSQSIRYVSNSPVILQKISYLNCNEMSSVLHFADFKNPETFNSKLVVESEETVEIKKSTPILSEGAKKAFNQFPM
jgi:hypothetical protein